MQQPGSAFAQGDLAKPHLVDAVLDGTLEDATGGSRHQSQINQKLARSRTVNGTTVNLTLTPLMAVAFAAPMNRVAKAEVLLRAGAEPNVNINGRTALMLACTGIGPAKWEPDTTLVRLLLKHGARLLEHPEVGCPLAWVIAHGGSLELLQLLVEAGERMTPPPRPFDPDSYQHAEFQWRCIANRVRDGDEDLAFTFPSLRADRDRWMAALSERYWPPADIPLHAAVRADRLDIVEWLLSKGANASELDSSGWSALYEVRSVEVLRALLRAGVGLDDTGLLWKTPLEWAARSPTFSLGMLEEFLSAERAANEPTQDVDEVILHVLCRVGHSLTTDEARLYCSRCSRFGRQWGRRPAVNDEILRTLVQSAEPAAVALACEYGILTNLMGHVPGECCGEGVNGSPLLHVLGAPRAREMIDVLRDFGARVLDESSIGETVAETAALWAFGSGGDRYSVLEAVRQYVTSLTEELAGSLAGTADADLEPRITEWLRRTFPSFGHQTHDMRKTASERRDLVAYLLSLEVHERRAIGGPDC